MRPIIAILGTVSVVVEGVEYCTIEDYDKIGAMSVVGVSNCLLTDYPADWQTCLDNVNVTSDCAQNINGSITDALDECSVPCETPDTQPCRLCVGMLAVQVMTILAPVDTGACGDQSDLEAIDGVCLEAIADGGFGQLTTQAEPSLDCGLCIDSYAQAITAPDRCSDYCGEIPTIGCDVCASVVMVSAIAYCNNNGLLPTVTCTVTDYDGLESINPAVVKSCVEGATEDDGFVECLGNGTTANMNESCVEGLDAHIDFRIGEVCNATICTEENLSADCLNCHGAIMVQEIFENAPNATGACGGADDRAAMADVEMTAVVACGREQASTGATCLGFQAEVSEICQLCLEERTERAMKQCKPHCDPEVTGPDCMECVNYGLMSAAAYCNAHSGVTGMMRSLSLVSIVAIISFVLSA